MNVTPLIRSARAPGPSATFGAQSRNRTSSPRNPPVVHLIGGTRPEAIKLAPVAAAMARGRRLRPVLVASGQHPTMFHQGLAAFGLRPDYEVAVLRGTGSQAELASQVLLGLDAHFERHHPDAVVVQGDTTTALAAALAAFWRGIPIVHLGAGLRSHDLAAPFPEEANRRLVGQLAALNLAPTSAAAANLVAENIPSSQVLLIGNTVVDAVRAVAATTPRYRDARLGEIVRSAQAGGCRLLLVTMHRRESWGEPLRRVFAAVADIVAADPWVRVVLPMHPNPMVRDTAVAMLGALPGVYLCDPLPYPELAGLLSAATLVASDSSGLQEEAPSFGVPVLVLRELTERMEAVEAGCAVLCGTDREVIAKTAGKLLGSEQARRAMVPTGNPFGDGRSGQRAEQAIARMLTEPERGSRPFVAPGTTMSRPPGGPGPALGSGAAVNLGETVEKTTSRQEGR